MTAKLNSNGARTLRAEWNENRRAYRLYDPENPSRTVAYEDYVDIAERLAKEKGYSALILDDEDDYEKENAGGSTPPY